MITTFMEEEKNLSLFCGSWENACPVIIIIRVCTRVKPKQTKSRRERGKWKLCCNASSNTGDGGGGSCSEGGVDVGD